MYFESVNISNIPEFSVFHGQCFDEDLTVPRVLSRHFNSPANFTIRLTMNEMFDIKPDYVNAFGNCHIDLEWCLSWARLKTNTFLVADKGVTKYFSPRPKINNSVSII